MYYITNPAEIYQQISQLAKCKNLWLDTEIADCNTPYRRLSLIQVLANPRDLTGEFAYIFDVLDKPDVSTYFINQIMVDGGIQKVFHNADFDLKYLGKNLAKNVTCTFKLAKKIRHRILQTTNLKLKTLAVELCHFCDVDKEGGASDWGKRPLCEKQLKYAAMDTVYLAAVHRRLLEICDPDAVNSIFNNNNFDNTTRTLHDMANPESENSSLTPTKLRLAFECPRIFYLNHRFNDKSLFIPEGSIGGIGNVFHKLADEFIDLLVNDPQFTTLFNPHPTQINLENLALEIQQSFYQMVFFPYFQTQEESKFLALHQVWLGLTGLIKKFTELLISNRNYCRARELIANTFMAEDRILEHDFNLPNGKRQLVRGKCDCLVFDFAANRFCVIEFKTYQPIDTSAQVAQVALYSYMLSERKKVPVNVAVYCVLPEFKEYKYTAEELGDNVHQVIPHKLLQMQNWLTWEPPQPNPPPMTSQSHLCQICPEKQKCQTFFAPDFDNSFNNYHLSNHEFNHQDSLNNEGKNSDQTNKTQKINPINPINPDQIGLDLVKTLESFGIGVEYQGAIVGPAFVRVKLKPHLGVKVNSLLKLSDDLRVQLGLERPPLIASQAGYVSVDLPRKEREIARFEDYIQKNFLSPTAKLKIALGVNIDGKLVEADLSDPNTCHFLVGGTTGSGKSEFLRSLLLSLLYQHSPEHLKIVLVDPKRVTFPEFETIPWLYSPVVKDSDRAIELMGQLVREMESRYQKFELAKCANITVYNQNRAQVLPRIVCIFDEYADFMIEKETRTGLEQSIKRLGAMARAAGIHLIIATQRPEATVVTPIIRSNLPGRIALRTSSAADSQIILGGKISQAADLLGKGDLVYLLGSELQRIQSLFAETVPLLKST
ncbi:MAG: DNA translocase FtsK [Sphaerospermopsis sp.]|nr:DNA translocase FtsK [Sphaerospermopsis sp.]